MIRFLFRNISIFCVTKQINIYFIFGKNPQLIRYTQNKKEIGKRIKISKIKICYLFGKETSMTPNGVAKHTPIGENSPENDIKYVENSMFGSFISLSSPLLSIWVLLLLLSLVVDIGGSIDIDCIGG